MTYLKGVFMYDSFVAYQVVPVEIALVFFVSFLFITSVRSLERFGFWR